jgi:hypothetical protein
MSHLWFLAVHHGGQSDKTERAEERIKTLKGEMMKQIRDEIVFHIAMS